MIGQSLTVTMGEHEGRRGVIEDVTPERDLFWVRLGEDTCALLRHEVSIEAPYEGKEDGP